MLSWGAMKDGWFERLVEAIETDSRSMKAISLAAGCGPAYVQQMVRYNKRPTVDRFIKLLKVLGRADSLYIILGADLTQQDEELYQVIVGMTDDQKRSAVAFLRSLQSS